jgi:hypothetical protein
MIASSGTFALRVHLARTFAIGIGNLIVPSRAPSPKAEKEKHFEPKQKHFEPKQRERGWWGDV